MLLQKQEFISTKNWISISISFMRINSKKDNVCHQTYGSVLPEILRKFKNFCFISKNGQELMQNRNCLLTFIF